MSGKGSTCDTGATDGH